MASVPEQRKPALPPPNSASGPIAWLQKNLFNGVLNSLVTILLVAALVYFFQHLLSWAVFNARFASGNPEACREISGACWSFVRAKHRLILFGTYPFDEQWRPLVGMILVIGMIALSCRRAFWKPWLGLAWILVLGAYLVLLGGWGGRFGLTFVRTEQWGGLPLTLLLAVVGVAVAFPLSIVLALGRRSHMPIIRALSVGYIELIRGVPLITLLFMASFLLPLFMPTGVSINGLIRAQIAVIVFTSSYLAEVIRGGLQAVPRGQYEAGATIGLTYWQLQRKIILPQALKISIPPIVNSFISMFKDTSLVAIIGLTDLLLATRQAIADPNWRPYFVEGYVFIAGIYWCFCYFMSKYSQYLERALYTGHKRS